MPKFENLKFEITISSIIKVLLLLCGLWLLIELREIAITILIAYIIIAALSPLIDALEKRKMKRGLAIAITYIVILLMIGILIFAVSKPLFDAVSKFINQLPNIIASLTDKYPQIKDVIGTNSTNLESLLREGYSKLGDQSGKAIQALFGIFGFLTSFFTVIIISVYGLLDKKGLFDKLFRMVSKSRREEFDHLSQKVEVQFGAWVRGQLALMVIIGVLAFISFELIGLGEYALPLAILAGLLELLPVIGPVVSGAIAVLVGLSISPLVATLALISSIAIQFLENHLVVPITMKKAVGLDPVFTIIAILVGTHLLGIVGAVLAVPVTAVVTSIILYYYDKRAAKVK